MSRKPFLAIPLAALLALAWGDLASAEQQKHKPRKHPAHQVTTTLTPRAPSHNPCAQYGAGFVRAADSDTCVKIGGYVGIDVGGRF